MKSYCILSDIHSNIFALKAVVEDARSSGVTSFINLGDTFYGPIAPRETFEFLINRNCINISGNQDREIIEFANEKFKTNPTMKFVLDDLGNEPLDWLKQLPFDLQINEDIYVCHGTPKDDLVYLLEDVRSGSPEVRSDGEILELLDGVTSKIILCGHSHIPRCVELPTGQLVINPGSVGLQAYSDDEPFAHLMQNYSPRASYVTLQKSSDKKWNINFHKVDYDYHCAAKAAKAQGRDDWEYFLSTGRAE